MNWKRWKNSPKKNEKLLRKLVALGGLVKVLPSGKRVGRMVAREGARKDRLSQWQFEINEKTGCWKWLRTLNKKHEPGYGFLHQAGERILAHRFYFERLLSCIPKGLTIDHLCKNTKCVNPSHLEPVTMKDNLLRGNSLPAINARKTHCCRGHPLSGQNIWRTIAGRRQCKMCDKIKKRKEMLKRLLSPSLPPEALKKILERATS